MFVLPPRLRTQGAFVSTLLGLACLGACEDPIASTDLRPAGEPEVLVVLTMNDPGFFFETATFCKQGDLKRPGAVAAGLSFEIVQICDDDLANPAGTRVTDPDTMVETFVPGTVADAVPTGWYTRIMFDELLNPAVEDLIEITEDADGDPLTPETGTGIFQGSLLNTQPVILKCNDTVVAYDGYYSPNGNNITWPLGPSLFIQPADLSTVASGSECTVEIKDSVVDKSGLTVPTAQRTGYTFAISALEFVEASITSDSTTPAADLDSITTDSTVDLVFNGFIDSATLAVGEVTITELPAAATACTDAGGVTRAAVITGDPTSQSISLTIAGGFAVDRIYTISFSDTNEVADLAGGTGALPGAAAFDMCFVTEAP